MCSGMKEYVTITKPDQPDVHVQKRIMIHDISDLYRNWIDDRNYETVPCLAYFAQCKPKQCIFAGQPGSHNICVCQEHQNVKLKLSAILPSLNYKDAMIAGVCSVENKNCMLKKCADCPKEEGIRQFLLSKIDSNSKNDVSFSIWTSVSIQNKSSEESMNQRVSLKNFTVTFDEFLDELVDDIYGLTEHHFISSAQKDYFAHCKKTLSKDTGLFIMDFAENYAYISQNSTQGFYFNNSSATLFIAALYYKDETSDELKHQTFCVISESLIHQAYSINKFMEVIIDDIKIKFPWIKKLIYFSDGAPTQFKNK